MAISKELLNVIVCPKCQGRVDIENDKSLICKACGLRYAINDDIPVLLIDSAEKIGEK